jgi:DNA-binding Lrp family transcriptional regulator
MLEQLFGSRTRVKLLRLFLNNPSQPFYLRELARKLKSQLNSVRREVENLSKIGIIKSVELLVESEKDPVKKKKKQTSKKYFLTDVDFLLYHELRALLVKAQLLSEKNFVSKIQKLAKIKLFILAGAFVGIEGASTDMLLVGTINHQKLASIVRSFEKDLGHPVNYTIMSYQEFKYRKDITDRFLYDILEGKKIVIIDDLTSF